MPANYAHYRFGAQVLKTLPADLQRPVQKYRRLYDIGVHGPDIFFYLNPGKKNPVSALAGKLHHISGQEFFTRLCKRIRLEPSEAATAYLYGVLTHYCLDSVCHPLINGIAAEGAIGHVQLETEFDRYLMALDGIPQPYRQDVTSHIHLKKEDAQLISGLFPPVTPRQVSQCIQTMHTCHRLLAAPAGPGRNVVAAVVDRVGPPISQYLMPLEPDPQCCHLDRPLLDLYDRAAAEFDAMGRQMAAQMTYGAPFGEDFSPIFG